MVGEPERKPLRLGGHQASYAAGLTAFTGLTAALAARDASSALAGARLARRSAAMGELEGGIGRRGDRQPPGREGKNSEFQIVPCHDGHVAVVYTVTHGRRRAALIGDPRLADPKFDLRAHRRKHVAELYEIITPWFADKTRAEIQATAQAKGVPFGPIFSPAELLETEQYVARGFLADLEHPAAGQPRHASASGPVERPLLRAEARAIEGDRINGVRVLDFGLLTAGANTSAMLADLGADVLKVESGAYLDPFRVVGKMDDRDGWWNRSPQFRFTNRNKRGLALNLKSPAGQRVIRELAQAMRRGGRELPPRRARSCRPRLQGSERRSTRAWCSPRSRARATPDRNA